MQNTWKPTDAPDTRTRQQIIFDYLAGTHQLPEGFVPEMAEFDDAIIAMRDQRANGWKTSPMGPRVSKI